MTGIDQVVTAYYETVHPFSIGAPEKSQTGQLAWAPVGFVESLPFIIQAKRKNPTDHENISFEMTQLNSKHFKSDQSRLPIAAIKLNSTEELLAVKAKKRLCILISKSDVENLSVEMGKAIKGREHLYRQDFYLIPIYGVQSEDHQGGYPVAFVDEIRKMRFPQFFYVPPYAPKQTQCDAFVYEGVARLDRLFVSGVHYRTLEFVDIKLHTESLKLLLCQLAQYLGLRADEISWTEFNAMRELLISQ